VESIVLNGLSKPKAGNQKFSHGGDLTLQTLDWQSSTLTTCATEHNSVWVLGQNGSGQNGTDKMVWTKWYWTKWYGQNGTDKMVRIKCYG